MSADRIRVIRPLFQTGDGGSRPTSALQLRFSGIDIFHARALNRHWHSRLPELTNWQGCFAFSAEFEGICYAVAIWGRPISAGYNGRPVVELRRMAISSDAPKNTASRMLAWMTRTLKKPRSIKLASAIRIQTFTLEQSTKQPGGLRRRKPKQVKFGMFGMESRAEERRRKRPELKFGGRYR